MKRIFYLMLSTVFVMATLLVPASASKSESLDSPSISNNFIKLTEIKISKEKADEFYRTAVEDELSLLYSTDVDLEISNVGLTAYSNGLVCQRLLIQEKRIGQVSGNAIDRWYRLSNKDEPVCRVSIVCTFSYDGTVATPQRDTYDFNIYPYPDYEANTYVTEKNVSFKNGTLISPSARVDTDYNVNYMTLSDNETISLDCTKDGVLTAHGQNESI